MDADSGTFEYCIEHRLLLEFLIIRYSEMPGTDGTRLDPIWAGLGLVALNQNKELQRGFEILISSGSYSIMEIIASSIDLFLAEWHRVERATSTGYLEKKIECDSLSLKTAKQFLSWSWREGRVMHKSKNVRFYMVWEVITWIGLSSNIDPEYVKEFDSICRSSTFPIETRLEYGLEIVKSGIFHRGIDKESLQDVINTYKVDKE